MSYHFVMLHMNMHSFLAKVSKGLAVMVLTEQVSESFFPILTRQKFFLDLKSFFRRFEVPPCKTTQILLLM